MRRTHDSPARRADRGAIESREVLLVAAAILALVVAAFVMPPTAAGGERPGDGTGSLPETTPSDGSDGIGDLLEWLDEFDIELRPGDGDGSGSAPVITDDALDPYSGCFVVVWDRLVPGSDATVLVWNNGTAQPGQQVWFNRGSIGHTNAQGRVDGRVPYSSELEVTVHLPAVDSCTFVHLGHETGFDGWRTGNDRPTIDLSSAEAVENVSQVDGNVSATFDVVGEPNLEVVGDPFPGETVQLRATVEDVPMRSATVTVNGREVGRTDENGSYTLQVPDDGTERLIVEVSRGDFSARETVTVLLLDVEVRSSLLALPGREAEAVTTIGDRTARDVTVRLDGEAVGTTGWVGRTAFELPPDPRATVTVTGYDQTATAAIWPLYLRTLLVVLVGLGVVVVSIRRASKLRSVGSNRLVGAGLAVLAVLAIAWYVAGRQGLALTLATGGLLAVALAGFVYRSAVLTLLERVTGAIWTILRGGVATLWAVVRGLQQLAIRLADGLLSLAEWAAARLRAGLARLAGAPLSVPALLGLGWTWLTGMLRALWRLRHRGREPLRSHLTARRLGVIVLATVAVGAGYALGGARGAIVAGAVVLALVGLAWRRSGTTTSPGVRDESAPEAVAGPTPDDGSTGEPSLRRLWRTFARWIVPGRLRSYTPGEVARAAIAQGFPRNPVERLTDVFREVEYGDRPLSDERYGRARAAFRALRGDRETEGEK